MPTVLDAGPSGRSGGRGVIAHADINGTSTAWRSVGNGPPLLMLHGGEGSHAMFEPLAAHLTDCFTLILYDQRDCGDTRNPPEVAVGLDLLADDARALVLHLGLGKVHVFGTSFGGRIAQVLALRHPEVVDRLVLGSTWPVPHTLAQLDPQGRARIQALRQGLPDTAEALAAEFIDPAHLERHPELKALFKNVATGSDRARRRAAALADVPVADASGIRAPTLLLCGERDRVVKPAFLLGMAELIAGARTVVLPGVGHATSLQSPERVAAELKRFLLS